MDKETRKEFNNLGRMVKKGFDDVDKRLHHFKQEVNKRFDALEQGQEDIKLRLDNVAYRFELQALEKRVEKVELKLGLRKN